MKKPNASHTSAEPLDRIITTRELSEWVPLNRSTIWKMYQAGAFPRPIQLSASRIGWRRSVVEAWLRAREADPLAARVNFPPGCGGRHKRPRAAVAPVVAGVPAD